MPALNTLITPIEVMNWCKNMPPYPTMINVGANSVFSGEVKDSAHSRILFFQKILAKNMQSHQKNSHINVSHYIG